MAVINNHLNKPDGKTRALSAHMPHNLDSHDPGPQIYRNPPDPSLPPPTAPAVTPSTSHPAAQGAFRKSPTAGRVCSPCPSLSPLIAVLPPSTQTLLPLSDHPPWSPVPILQASNHHPL